VRLALLLVTAALVVVPAAATATGAKTIGTRGAVISISADGGRVAIHAQLGDDPQCDFGAVWQPARAVIRLGSRDTCPQPDDAEFDGLALAGDVAVWTNYNFGNHAYCAGPFIASLRTLRAVATGACPGEPNGEDMHWEYKGSGAVLVARSYTRCQASCAPDYSKTYDAAVALWSVGPGGLKKLVAVPNDTKLLDVDAGRVLLRDPSGKLLVLGAAGRQVGSVPVKATAAWLDGASRVSVASGTTLTTYDARSGRVVETCTMKRGAEVQDVENGRAVYFAGAEVHLLTIATNADRVVARQRGLVRADLEPGGLFYAYNVPRGGPKPGRVTYLPLK
jgi:hypothetical protein